MAEGLFPKFIEKYDTMILSPSMRAMYNGTDFYNVGNWEHPGITLGEACESLVTRHLDRVKLEHSPRSILDVGCGLGASTACLAKNFPHSQITGINISSKQIEHARRQFPGIGFKVMDAACLDIPGNSVDLIISVEAAFHFDTREEFLWEAYRVLRSGGQLVFSDIVINDSRSIGEWSVPKANLLSSTQEYQRLLESAPFMTRVTEDITSDTWMGFCSYLQQQSGMEMLARSLRGSVIAYMMSSMTK